ncbi:DUF3800 domain-containing protein [Haloarcula sp. GH36]|uniref:DUF3800 domain-containing protein n=1 Tax=Haloarcula montana TaxID=3111776 RepID=UPI002D78FB64|nr:DUF3800 domain-containing protein [Haloarcula sp. GH36]
MDYFGDESGHLKGVLQGDCEICVMAIVAGDKVSCGQCAKRAVRNIDDIPEAKWNDLLDKQKRRLFECLADNEHIEFGFATFTQEKLRSVDGYHYLHQDVKFPPAWDLALAGYAYGEILYEMGASNENIATFTFDRISSKKQSEKVADHFQEYVPGVSPFIKGSRQSPGIQTADCLAGAVAEDHKGESDWLSNLDQSNITECSYSSLAKLETDLHRYETEP